MTKLNGIAASNGIAFGKAYELVEPDLSYETYQVEDTGQEKVRFKEARDIAENELKQIRDKVAREQGEDNAKNVHYEVGKKVRKAIADIGGMMPEEMPTPKKSLKELEKERKLLENKEKKKLETE